MAVAKGNSSLPTKFFSRISAGSIFELGGENVHHALDAVSGFGAAGAAIGIGGDAVGEDADDVGRRCS